MSWNVEDFQRDQARLRSDQPKPDPSPFSPPWMHRIGHAALTRPGLSGIGATLLGTGLLVEGESLEDSVMLAGFAFLALWIKDKGSSDGGSSGDSDDGSDC